ncbi:hypothetical protein DOTSEDRAFT_80599 [Dothistroma septosporum NZE10]|uniref:Uncharacterized protein n=1 Tax=Dothistroma septosporum (strain NZE10 / CBS 128990) TaxID=675120 RepID=M2YM41_DOTSN|nr:hypothetical protein DOTSEDRAFT_80599 [Dothistroma septosporum NZE10]
MARLERPRKSTPYHLRKSWHSHVMYRTHAATPASTTRGLTKLIFRLHLSPPAVAIDIGPMEFTPIHPRHATLSTLGPSGRHRSTRLSLSRAGSINTYRRCAGQRGSIFSYIVERMADDYRDDSDSDWYGVSDDEWDESTFSDGLLSHQAITSFTPAKPNPSHALSAAEKVFVVTELAEMIFVEYVAARTADAVTKDEPRMEPLQSNSAIRRVSRTFNWTIDGSSKLRTLSRVYGLGREKVYLLTDRLIQNHAPLLWMFSHLLPCWSHVRAFEIRPNNDSCIFLDGVNAFTPPTLGPLKYAQASVELARKKLLPFCKSGKDGRESWRQYGALQYGGRIVLETPRICTQRFQDEPGSGLTVSWEHSYRDKDIRLDGTATLGEVFDAYSGWLYSVPAGALIDQRWECIFGFWRQALATLSGATSGIASPTGKHVLIPIEEHAESGIRIENFPQNHNLGSLDVPLASSPTPDHFRGRAALAATSQGPTTSATTSFHAVDGIRGDSDLPCQSLSSSPRMASEKVSWLKIKATNADKLVFCEDGPLYKDGVIRIKK